MAGAQQLPPYAEFSLIDESTIATRWSDWLDGFQAMLRAMKITDDADRRAMLLYYVGNDVRKLFKKLDGTGDDNNYRNAHEALTKYFAPTMNRVYLMNSLQNVKQQPRETVDSFYMRVREKLVHLDLEKLSKAEIVELVTLAQLVNNCENKALRTKALKDGLRLKEFLDNARAYERAELQSKEIDSHHTAEVKQVRDNHRSRPRNRSGQRSSSSSKFKSKQKSNTKCYRCGGTYPHHDTPCPAKFKKCNKCHKEGHFESVCRTRNIQQKSINVSDDEYIGIVHAGVNTVKKTVDVFIGDNKLHVLIDTGAQVNCINKETYLGIPEARDKLLPSDKMLYPYGSMTNPLPTLGRLKVKLKSKDTDKMVKTVMYVIDDNTVNLLSCETSVELNLINFTNAVNTSMDSVVESYKDRFEGMGKMKEVQVSLHINTEVKPVEQKTRRIPFHVRNDVDAELKRLIEQDIIEPAEGPTPWVSPIVVVHKKVGVRICIDSRQINKAIEREKHPIPTIEDLIVDLNGSKYFSKIDLNKGYHQLELSPESRYITTFTTHEGLFRYKRLCFGINSASEIFQKAVQDMLKDIKGVKNISDDIIIYSQTKEDHISILQAVLERMRQWNITANKTKCEFMKDSVVFYGHVFTGDGVKAAEQKVTAIQEANRPQNVAELRSLLGMAQYLSRFVKNYSDVVAPLRKLTHQSVEWCWNTQHEKAFQNLKQSLANSHSISYFDTALDTEIIVDASPTGLGGILTQHDQHENLKVIAYGSRSLTDTESRYSQTEREMLAVVWACEHFHLYIYGADITIVSDHKPLESIVNKCSKTTARLERLNLRLQPYRVKLIYRPGKDNPADYLSRHPKETTLNHISWIDQQVQHVYNNAISPYQHNLSSAEIKEETQNDPMMQRLATTILTQKWNESDPNLAPYKNVKDELSVADGFILRDTRLVVPNSLQRRAIDLAHSSHQGIVKTKKLLRETLWFPGIDKMVEQVVADCLPCQASTTKQTETLEPLKMSKLPDAPWKEVSTDFCGPFGTDTYLLVVIDEYSRFPEVEIIRSLTAESVIPHFDAIFARQGVPEIVKSDNGPPFNGYQFARWSQVVGFTHRKITPLWPRANSEAERFMRTMKKAIRASMVERGSWRQELYRFLRHYRATPHSITDLSPSEMLNGRKLRTEIPKSPASTQKKVRFADQDHLIRLRDTRLKQYMKELADARNHAKPSDLHEGDHVLIPNQKQTKLTTPYIPEPYEVVNKKGSMITVKNGSGHEVTRNSSMFKKISRSCGNMTEREDIDTSSTPNTNNAPQNDDTEDVPTEPRRSSREKKEPQYLKDFVLNVIDIG